MKNIIKLLIILNVIVFSLLTIGSTFASSRNGVFNDEADKSNNEAESLSQEAAEMGMVPLDNSGIWVIPGPSRSATTDKEIEQELPEQVLPKQEKEIELQRNHPSSTVDSSQSSIVRENPVVVSNPVFAPPPVVTFTPEFLLRVKSEGLKEIPGSGIWVSP